ncbi:MAG TPA: tetratricopeptide repeat protein, partial [Pirellulaceae bacterium]
PQVLLAVYFQQNGHSDRAQALLQEAHRKEPRHPVPEFFLGQFAIRNGRLAQAREHLDRAVSLPIPRQWPKSHRRRFLILLHAERFQLAQRLKDQSLARAALETWITLEPENKRLQELQRQFSAEHE